MTPEDIKKVRCPRDSVFKGNVTMSPQAIYAEARRGGLLDGVTMAEFGAVVKAMGADIAARLLRGAKVTLPQGLGTLQVMRGMHGVWVDETGAARSAYPVDWKRTLEWWCADEEARLAKRKVYNTAKRSSLSLVHHRGLRMELAGVETRFKPRREFIREAEEYAAANKGVGYPIKRRRHEKRER